MTISINLTPELEKILQDRANHQGQDIADVASELLMQVLLEDTKSAKDPNQTQGLEILLQNFEAKYNMESRSFHQQFQAGTLGDSADFFEWNTYYEMLN